ncbi:MAG: glycosyltransferase family 4 protein [Rhodothermales bacterium]|nr:glycosyltransferase family 4 protein [Rhodothermales bacterium]
MQFDSGLTGSAISAFLVADGLREGGWETHVAFGHDGPIIDRFRAASHAVHIVPHKNWIRTDEHLYFFKVLYWELQASKAFYRLIEQVRPDLVFVNSSVSLAGARAAHRHGLPCVWYLRELFANVGGEMKVPAGFKPLIRAGFKTYASRIVVNSEATALNMIGAPPQRLDVVPNAVGTPFFQCASSPAEARRKFGLPEGGTVVGVPGTLRPTKGHPFFFRALPHLGAGCQDFAVAVTGSGTADYEQELRAMVQELNLTQPVHFLGNVHDMPSFYRACDLVCVPSEAEAFGRTVIEAFAVGTPVVASAVGGIRETVRDGDTGLLVPYGDTQALASALRRLLQDAALRDALQRNALREAEALYHESTYKARVCQIAAEVCGHPSPAAPRAAA